MRRKEREITDKNEILAILGRAEVLRIALNNGNYPYVLPVNFGFQEEDGRLVLFFHGSREGTKHEVIARDPHVTFEVDGGHALLRPAGAESCTASYAYESVIGQGTIEPAAEEEKEALLAALLAHYGIEAQTFNPVHLANTVVYKIRVESCTAKRRVNDRG